MPWYKDQIKVEGRTVKTVGAYRTCPIGCPVSVDMVWEFTDGVYLVMEHGSSGCPTCGYGGEEVYATYIPEEGT